MKGRKHTEETKLKISLNNIGKHYIQKSRREDGYIPWNTGKTYFLINIDEQELRKYYLEDNLTINECAEKFGCSSNPINRALKRYNIPRRLTTVKSDRVYPKYWKGKHTPEEITRRRIETFHKNYKPENHYNWKGGITPISKLETKSNEWKNWRKQVFERDDYTCQICGKRGVELHPHHIKKRSEYPELKYDVNNGITLCNSCHAKVHNYKKGM